MTDRTKCVHAWGIKSANMSTKIEECFTEYFCFKCQATHIKTPENTMTDRTEQVEIEELARLLCRQSEDTSLIWESYISRAIEIIKSGYTRSNSPDTVKLERLDYKELGDIFHTQFPLGDWCSHYKYALAKTAIDYCTRFGTVKESNTDHTNYACICKECGGQVKVPTVGELGDFIYQTLHTTGGEPTNTLSKLVCYELGRLIHQLLTGGAEK